MSPLVLLHGFTGAPSTWDALVLAAPNRRIFRPWLGGHGVRPAPCGATFDEEIERLARAMREEGISGAHLVGYSLGARVALGLLVRHPELFSAATLVGVNPGLATDEARAQRREADAKWIHLLETHGLELFVEAWARQTLFASQRLLPREVVEAEHARRLQHTAAGLASSLRSMGLAGMPDWSPHLPEVRIPVTFVAGERDPKFSALARTCADRTPHARFEIVPGSGHNVVLERPDAIASLLEREST